MKQYYAQHAKMVVKPGMRDEAIRLLGENVAVLQQTPGCVYYLISTPDEEDAIWISELWESLDAKEALAKNPESGKVMQQLMPLLTSVTDKATMTVVGGYGVE